MIDPEEHPELVPPIDEDEEREYELAMQNLHDRLFAIEDEMPETDEFSSDEFALAMLEAMSTPVDPNSKPSAWTCGFQGPDEQPTDEQPTVTPPAD